MPGFLGGSSAGSSGTGGEISFPKEFVDPVTKLRVSNPQNLIDTDFEYGLQPTKWETVELINNTPSFFSKSGDTTIPGVRSIITNAGTREIIVTTALDHGLAVGIPINVQGTKSVTADGSYIINSIPDTKTFTYLARDIQSGTTAIEDLYTSIITGEFFQGSQLRIADADGIVTDAESTSTLTVTTENPHGFGPNTPFYFLNLNSTISQEFEAANTAAKSFDASNSATAQTFDGSNTLSSLNIDWSNSATVGGTPSTISGVNTTANTITVSHSTENFSALNLGDPLYYTVNASLGYFLENPRGVVFLKTVNDLDVGSSTFQVSEVPDGTAINLQSNMTGTFQIANQARTFAGNNVDSATETVINVAREAAIQFEGANNQALGGNGVATLANYSGSLVNVSVTAGAGLDYYQGAMVRYNTTGSAASGLTNTHTYFIDSFFSTGTDTFAFTLKAFPNDESPISITGGTGTQTFSRIGVSLDKDIVHIKNSFYNEKDMLEYEFPVAGAFEADEEKVFYFVSTAYDQHNYRLNPVSESFIAATGGSVIQTVVYEGRNYTVHRFTSQGTFTFTITDAGTFGQDIKYVVSNGSFDGDSSAGLIESSFPSAAGSYTVVVNSGGRVDVAYPQDGGTNNIPFNVINPVPITATGGSTSDITVDGVSYRVHKFTAVGTSTFAVQSTGNIFDSKVEYLIVAGGGGGGRDNAGGGGAGGLLQGEFTPSSQNYSVVVAAGGTDNPLFNYRGLPGGNSSVFGLTALGGGGGGGGDGGGSQSGTNLANAQLNGGNGGSGGGAASEGGNGTVGLGTAGQGNNGGAGASGSGGGGGGAGGVGTNATANNQPGSGGIGIQSDIDGTLKYYAGGGGGAPENSTTKAANTGLGGLGGGGFGANPGQNGQNGAANTGGGGGGAQFDGSERRGGTGGSGIVIIRYPLETPVGGGAN